MENPFDSLHQAIQQIDSKLDRIEARLHDDFIAWDWVDINKACELLAYKKPTLYKKVSNGEIPSHKRDNKLFFSLKELDKWIRNSHDENPDSI